MKLIPTLISFVSIQTICYGQFVTFDLSNYNPTIIHTHNQIKFYNITDFNTDIDIVNIPTNVGFYIVQIHSYFENVTLSSTAEFDSQTYVAGVDIGLVGSGFNNSTFYLATNSLNVSVMIAITIHSADDPVPGGCNLSLNTEVAPYQLVSYTDEVIIVKSQPPSMRGIPCEVQTVRTDLYHMYLIGSDHNPTDYFKAIKSMLTVDDIKLNGRKVTTVDGYFKYNKFYSSYRGTGQVFAIIASFNNNQTSAYVPIVSYGCDVKNWEEDCYTPVTTHFKVICAFLIIIGAFICFFGHSYSMITSCLSAITAGFFFTYTSLSLFNTPIIKDTTIASIIVAIIFGICWIFIILRLNIPIVSISFTYFFAAFLFAAIIFYAGLADRLTFTSNLNYWTVTFTTIIVFFLIGTILTVSSHIFACTLLGSYAFITALSYYFGGNLQYIFINVYRRIVVKDFNMATIDPPFSGLDIVKTIIWVVWAGIGYYYQWCRQRGRSPFPSFVNRRPVVYSETTETTPLLPNILFYNPYDEYRM